MTLTLFRGGLLFDGTSAETREGLEVLVEGDPVADLSALSGAGETVRLVMKGGAVFKDTL